MSLAEVKAHLSEVVSRVNGQHERLEETIAVLADETLIRDLTSSEVDLAAGRVEDADSLAFGMRARK